MNRHLQAMNDYIQHANGIGIFQPICVGYCFNTHTTRCLEQRRVGSYISCQRQQAVGGGGARQIQQILASHMYM